MKFKFYISIIAVFLVCGMNFIYAFEPVEDDHDENDPGGGSGMTCKTGVTRSTQKAGYQYHLACSSCSYKWVEVTGHGTCTN